MITREQALEALDSMDDFARMDIGVDAFGPRETLRQYIEQQAEDAGPGEGETPADAHDKTIEAACILRAATSVDVAELIELAAKAIYDQWADQLGWVEWVPGGNSLNQDEARSIARAALESALRMALAGREGFVMVPVEPTPEMVDVGSIEWENHNSGSPYDAEIPAIYRAMIAAAPKGTP